MLRIITIIAIIFLSQSSLAMIEKMTIEDFQSHPAFKGTTVNAIEWAAYDELEAQILYKVAYKTGETCPSTITGDACIAFQNVCEYVWVIDYSQSQPAPDYAMEFTGRGCQTPVEEILNPNAIDEL